MIDLFIDKWLSYNFIFKGEDIKKWTKHDGGWTYHLISTISEWSCALAICIYIISFTNEFRELQLTFPKVKKKKRNVFNLKKNYTTHKIYFYI